MPPFPKPKFRYGWDKNKELKAIRDLKNHHKYGLPKTSRRQLLIGTWNIANFDVQKRPSKCYDLIAEIIKSFDLIAIQEVNAKLKGIIKLMETLGKNYSCVFTDVAGNEERLCYIYKHNIVKLTEMIGELSIPPSRKYKLPFKNKQGKKIPMEFKGFDRTPFVVAWKANSQKFTTYNNHLFYGAKENEDIKKFRRRILEVYSLAKWVENRVKNHIEKLYSKNIILLGDMNIPKMQKSDPVYKQLVRHHMKGIPYHDHMEEGSNLAGDMYYDQLVFVRPFANKIKLKRYGIFAWDNAVFASLWNLTQNMPRKRTRIIQTPVLMYGFLE